MCASTGRRRELGLRGKPAPDTFLAAAGDARRPAEAAVFEDALAGVAAGRAGGFGLVVGVDRSGTRPRFAPRGRRRRRRPRRAAGVRDRARCFAVEPWSVRETRLDLDALASTESMFALANGHIGLRANLDEGEPYGLPGTYLNSFYELRPLPYAEGGYGYPESGQTLVNVTNGKIIRLLVDDEPFDVRYGELRAHERVLDLRDGRSCAERSSGSRRPARAFALTTTRLVSFVAARRRRRSCYEVEPLDGPLRVVVQSELVANEPAPAGIDGPARRGGARIAARVGGVLPPRRARRARPLDAAEQAADRSRDGPRGRGPGGHATSRPRARRTWAA